MHDISSRSKAGTLILGFFQMRRTRQDPWAVAVSPNETKICASIRLVQDQLHPRSILSGCEYRLNRRCPRYTFLPTAEKCGSLGHVAAQLCMAGLNLVIDPQGSRTVPAEGHVYLCRDGSRTRMKVLVCIC